MSEKQCAMLCKSVESFTITILYLYLLVLRRFFTYVERSILRYDKEESEKGRLFRKLNSFDESLVLEDCTWLRRCNTCIALVIQVASKFEQFPLVEINAPRVAIHASLLNN